MFPSGSLNQAPFSPPSSAIPSTVFSPGMSYSSNVTPLARRSVIAASMSLTRKPPSVCWAVPGELGGIQEQDRVPRVVSDPGGVLPIDLEAQDLLVELPGPGEVLRGDRRAERPVGRILQVHGPSLLQPEPTTPHPGTRSRAQGRRGRC